MTHTLIIAPNSSMLKRKIRIAIEAFASAFLLLQPMPVRSQGMNVKCLKGSSSNPIRCNLDIFNAVLEGKYGYLVRVKFENNDAMEAFCLDEKGEDCRVRFRHSQWERVRIRWVQNYPGFKAAFFIENSNNLVLGAYDAPNSY